MEARLLRWALLGGRLHSKGSLLKGKVVGVVMLVVVVVLRVFVGVDVERHLRLTRLYPCPRTVLGLRVAHGGR